MKYPNRLKTMRKRAGISQEKLETALSTGRSTITKLEAGERKLSDQWKERAAAALSCEPWELLPADLAPTADATELVQIFEDLDEERRERLMKTAQDLLKALQSK